MKMALVAKPRSEVTPPAAKPVAALRASVLIPTHNRRQLLERTLSCLSRQTVDLSTIEVIVVADGCSDGTLDMLRLQRWPFALRVLQHAQRGSAASRNAAAAVARAPILIFLDDDVMPAPDLVEKHLAAHSDGLPTVAIGRLAPASMPGVPGWWRWLEGQLDRQYRAMLRGKRPIDGVCLYTGNCSISRDAFLQIHGFNERLEHSEDIELGMRLEKAGVSFRLALDASAEHWGCRGYSSWREMARCYGRWDAGLVFKAEFPSALERLRAEYRSRGRLRQALITSAIRDERRLGAFVRTVRAVAVVAGVLRLAPLERKAYGAIYDLTYWKGVSDELGGLRAVARDTGRTI
jgi:glycosyltransferase involved in cell wall biosynthesis